MPTDVDAPRGGRAEIIRSFDNGRTWEPEPKRLLIDGKPHQDFDPRKETVTLTPSPSQTTKHVSVQY